MKTTLKFFSTFIMALILSIGAWAAEISQVKGNRVMINNATGQAGDLFFVVSGGKRVGIVQIRRIRGGKAIAEIRKGRAAVGATLVARSAAGSTGGSAASTASSSGVSGLKKKTSIGVLAGLGMHNFSMDIGPANQSVREKGKLSGMSMLNLKGFYDYDLSPSLTIRAAAGIESFTAKGTLNSAYCETNSKECSVDFMYLAMEGSAHWNFIQGSTSKLRAYLGLGYSFLISASNKKTIANLQTSGTNNMILGTVGMDYPLSGGSFIPVAVDYGMFPGSADVVATSIYFRVGYGFPF